jgi:4-amino-4-deoxy-L-arabinose transferase-like glycosyltransferase
VRYQAALRPETRQSYPTRSGIGSLAPIVKALQSAPAEAPPSVGTAAGFGEGPSAVLLVAALTFAFALAGTRYIPLIDRDEGRYAEAAREMLVSGDWLVPRIFAVPYLEKPPLFYWLTAVSYAAAGVNELGARMVPAVSAALGVLATGLFGRRIFGGGAGVLGAAVLATSGLHLLLARVAITDMLFGALLTGALFAFFVAETERRTFLPFWVLAAAATLTKGPVAPVLCGLVGVSHLALVGRWQILRAARFWIGFPLFLAIVAPWFLLIQARYPAFLPYYVYKEHLLRVAGDEHREPFFWYLPWIVVGFLPWSVVACGALPAIRDRLRDPSAAGVAARFLIVWAAWVFAFFSVPRGKLVPYMLPVLPPLALLVGDALQRWRRGAVVSRGGARAG